MRDPLQAGTPYEILGVKSSATKGEVDLAYMKALQRGVPQQVAKSARDALQQPAERARLALEEYDDETLRSLTPCPLADSSVLSPDRRAATAAAWEKRLRTKFPDAATLHSLGVLWYHWTLHEEIRHAVLRRAAGNGQPLSTDDLLKENLLRKACAAAGLECNARAAHACRHAQCPYRDDCRSSAPSVEQMWQKVIACWVAVASQLGGWHNPSGIQLSTAEEALTTLLSSVRTKLVHLGMQYAADYPVAESMGSGATGLSPARCYHELESALDLEWKTAKAMTKAGIRIRSKNLRCGRLLLEQVDLLKPVRSEVRAALTKNPASATLRELDAALSPYSLIDRLIQSKQPRAALEAIDRIASSERSSKEVASLRVRALLVLGQQQVEVGNDAAGLDTWGQALQQKKARALLDQVRSEIVSTARTRAAAMQAHDRDAAIGLLEHAVKLVDDQSLVLTLAEILTDRGVDVFVGAQHQQQRDGELTREIMDAFRTGLRDLERAAKLGSKRAAQQAQLARQEVAAAEENFLDVPAKAYTLINQADAAARKDPADWDAAIKRFREALSLVDKPAATKLKKRLAACLCNRGIKNANRGVELLNEEVEQLKKAVDQIVAGPRIPSGLSDDHCSHCFKSKHMAYGESWYTVGRPDGTKMTLCAGCGAEFQVALQQIQSHEPSRKVANLLTSARADLQEAAKLDPTNKHIRENLQRLLDVLKNVRGVGSASSERGRAAEKLPAIPKALDSEEAELDRILEKVSEQGIHSLSNNERQTLERLTRARRAHATKPAEQAQATKPTETFESQSTSGGPTQGKRWLRPLRNPLVAAVAVILLYSVANYLVYIAVHGTAPTTDVPADWLLNWVMSWLSGSPRP